MSSYDGTLSHAHHGEQLSPAQPAGKQPISIRYRRTWWLSAGPRVTRLRSRKGLFGYGFTLKSVRVYLSEHSDYYTIEHIVTAVVEGKTRFILKSPPISISSRVQSILSLPGSPAYEAGLRSDDLITAVNGQPVHNLTHPQLMHRLLSYGNELQLKVSPD